MKIWFANRKSAKDESKTQESVALMADKELSDDLMAQISGGRGKGACHTAALA